MTRIAERQKTQTPQDGDAQAQKAFEEKSSQKEDSLNSRRFVEPIGKTPFTFRLIFPQNRHDSP